MSGRMNWDRVRSEDNIRRYGSERLETSRATGISRHPSRLRTRNTGLFRVKWGAPCANCGTVITVGNAAKYNVNAQIVHPKGCPKRTTPH